MPVRRVFVISFRGCEISVLFGSFREEFDLRVATEVKLTVLKFEN